ncbi:methyltransferase family protein [Paraburkholderia sp. BL8N3]|nr:methyltransferase domain-containing protein [Paraburkholderia sp. BL8N3]TCK42753.1 methyltransferase family protein [Paraburkholderia sp. BL8N3]
MNIELTKFLPMYSGKRLVPKYPNDGMTPQIRELWTYFSEKLGWKSSIHSRATFDFLVNAMEFSKGRPVLDAGAGHQRYKPFFSDALYLSQEHPDGIDFKNMQSLQYDFISPIDQRIPVMNGSIACVINTSVLEHVRYPERFLKEAFRVLCAGGRIYMHVPFSYCEHEQPYDFQRPTRYGLSAWLKEAGFNKVSVLPSSNSVYGSSSFLLDAMQTEFSARGLTKLLESLSPILKHIIALSNSETDDYIDADAIIPIGWLAVAEKDGNIEGVPFSSNEKSVVLRDIAV